MTQGATRPLGTVKKLGIIGEKVEVMRGIRLLKQGKRRITRGETRLFANKTYKKGKLKLSRPGTSTKKKGKERKVKEKKEADSGDRARTIQQIVAVPKRDMI